MVKKVGRGSPESPAQGDGMRVRHQGCEIEGSQGPRRMKGGGLGPGPGGSQGGLREMSSPEC